MDVAPTKKVFNGFSLASSEDALSLPITEARRRTYVVLSLVALALVLRLYAISLYPLGFDEYGSIWEAKLVGLNWNSIIYSTVMHLWVRLGTSEQWLRLPAAIFGAATVPIIFKIGEKLGGWRTALVAGLLAAVSPFNIYHSQEVRFYSLFILSSAAFMLATISYVDSRRGMRNRLLVLATALILFVSHFLGMLAIYAQGSAAFVAANTKRRLRTALAVTFGLPILIFGLPIIPFARNTLLHLYRLYANAGNADVSASRLSLINFAKLAYAGYTFVFGYHVYPLRLVVVIPGLVLTAFLLGYGIHRLWQQPEWRALPFTYLLALIGVYTVLDSIGGRVAVGVSPRHVAFLWPAFVTFLALGLSSFRRLIFQVLLVVLLSINAISLWYGWQRDWTYGVSTDYRSAAAYAGTWAHKSSALIGDGRSQDQIDFYFPKSIPSISSPGPEGQEPSQAFTFGRLIMVTNDWRGDSRRESDELLRRLSSRFTWIDGRVEYPMFEYVLERKPSSDNPGYPLISDTGQLRQPLSFYGVEFQDLRLPISVKVEGMQFQVVGAYGLPNSEGSGYVTIPLAQPAHAGKAILLTNVVGLSGPQLGQTVAEVIVESKSGAVNTFPLRLGRETASWAEQCQPNAECQTVFQWHKRLAMTGQNSFSDAWRDFQAGLHAVALDLPPGTEVTTVKLHYLATSGHLCVWGIAFPAESKRY
jgi:hypothetical protein